MDYITKIDSLKNIIDKELLNLINNDYVLLDVPYHYNIGDVLIWNGELEFLKQLPYKHLNFGYYYQNFKITDNTIILLHGGGNFGDLWRGFQDYRLEIISKYPNNKIVVFPQTVYYQHDNNMKADSQLMSRHKNLTICARDTKSYSILKENFQNNILLVPDMAFYMSIKKLKKYILREGEKNLFLKRNDKELLLSTFHADSESFDVLDWPTEDGTLELYCMWDNYLLKTYRRCDRRKYLKKIAPFFKGLNDLYIHTLLRNKITKIGVGFVSKYKSIYSTRLHTAILGLMINKKVVFFDNTYGKNKNFYNSWLTDLNIIKMIP